MRHHQTIDNQSLLSDSNWRVLTEQGYKSCAIIHYAKKACWRNSIYLQDSNTIYQKVQKHDIRSEYRESNPNLLIGSQL